MDFKLRGTQFFNKLHFKGGGGGNPLFMCSRRFLFSNGHGMMKWIAPEFYSTLSEHLGTSKMAAPHVHSRPRSHPEFRPLQSPSPFWTNSILGMEREMRESLDERVRGKSFCTLMERAAAARNGKPCMTALTGRKAPKSQVEGFFPDLLHSGQLLWRAPLRLAELSLDYIG